MYTDTIPAAEGCDSIIAVNLTILNSTTNILSPIECNSYISPSGKVWNESGFYTNTIPNVAGCDSIITVNLTVLHSTVSKIEPTACSNYISPSGKVWTESGTFTDTILNTAGCDSIITINLTIDNSVTQNQANLSANTEGANYQWLDCNAGNAPLDAETNRTYSAITSGSYAVIVSEGECSDTSGCYEVIITSLSDKEALQGISYYPNPVKDELTIEFLQATENLIVEVSAVNGEAIIQKQFENAKHLKIDVSALDCGVYVVRLKTEKSISTLKIVKE
jgi:hypothetical protein